MFNILQGTDYSGPVWDGALGCNNRAHCIAWPEVVKGIPNHGCKFIVCVFMFWVLAVFCFFVFDCQYQGSQLPGKMLL